MGKLSEQSAFRAIQLTRDPDFVEKLARHGVRGPGLAMNAAFTAMDEEGLIDPDEIGFTFEEKINFKLLTEIVIRNIEGQS
ncbi:MAG: hypothetical protein M3Q36_01975 [bacterium]|nr:hypothetical protein [bacterium]